MPDLRDKIKQIIEMYIIEENGSNELTTLLMDEFYEHARIYGNILPETELSEEET